MEATSTKEGGRDHLFHYHHGGSMVEGRKWQQVDGYGGVPREPSLRELSLMEISPDLTCPVCLDVLKEATTIIPCGHTLCSHCLKDVFANGETCPVCRVTMQKPLSGDLPGIPVYALRNIINSLQVRCKYGVSYNFVNDKFELLPAVRCSGEWRRCEEVLSFSQLEKHVASCPRAPIACPYAPDGCPVVLIIEDAALLAKHIERCEWKTMECARCHKMVRLVNMMTHLSISCDEVAVCCVHAKHGCREVTKRRFIGSHVINCPYEKVKASLMKKDARVAALMAEVEALRAALWLAKANARDKGQKTWSMEGGGCSKEERKADEKGGDEKGGGCDDASTSSGDSASGKAGAEAAGRGRFTVDGSKKEIESPVERPSKRANVCSSPSKERKSTTINVFIAGRGEPREKVVRIFPDIDTLSDLEVAIFDTWKLDNGRYFLTFEGHRVEDDDRPLGSYGLVNGSTLRVNLRIRSQAEDSPGRDEQNN